MGNHKFICLSKHYRLNVLILLNTLFVHIIGLCIVTFTEIGIATASAVMHDQFYAATNHSLLNAVKFFYAKPQYEIELDQLQTDFKCCGAKSYMDYRKLAVNIPFTCLVGHLVYARGCIEVLSDYIQQYIIVMISLCFIFSIIQGVYLIISILMFNRSVDKKNCFT
ncbi:25 kDa integral membrane protein [Schistosoma japonicum]|nr:25 kDa integral membrane protein [Schistosoma japonicum]